MWYNTGGGASSVSLTGQSTVEECEVLCTAQAVAGVCAHKRLINDATWGTSTPCYFAPGAELVDYRQRHGWDDTRHYAAYHLPSGCDCWDPAVGTANMFRVFQQRDVLRPRHRQRHRRVHLQRFLPRDLVRDPVHR